jgi:eukaryotic-like serine/threonine-protein kinase
MNPAELNLPNLLLQNEILKTNTGPIFAAQQLPGNKDVSIKILDVDLTQDPGFANQFPVLSQQLQQLVHPNIARVLTGSLQPKPYLVMEQIPPVTSRMLLQRHVNAKQAIPLDLILDIARQVSEALEAAHQRGILHGELKPETVLLLPRSNGIEDTYQVKVVDFGLAHAGIGPPIATVQQGGGTHAYLAPERWQGTNVGKPSDFYSLGITIYELATGMLPFTASSITDSINHHYQTVPRAPSQTRADLPPAFDALVLKCLEKNPINRYATAADLAAGIRALQQQSQPDPSRHPTLAMPAPSKQAPKNVAASTLFSAQPRIQVIDGTGTVVQTHEIHAAGLTLGRYATNNIVLDDPSISRHHLRFDLKSNVVRDTDQASSKSNAVQVTDQASSNGTFHNGNRLLAHTPQTLSWGSALAVGRFWLYLEVPSPPNRSRVGISFTNKGGDLTLEPGQPAMLEVNLKNLGTVVDQINIRMKGIPTNWVEIPKEVKFMPGESQAVTIIITVPRSPEGLAGKHKITLQAISSENPDQIASVEAIWTINAFFEISLEMTPKKASGLRGAKYTTTLHNKGNSKVLYMLEAEDDAHNLKYDFRPTSVTLDPGEVESSSLKTIAGFRPIGVTNTRSFRVKAQAIGPGLETAAAAQFDHRALFPVWVPPMLLALLAALGFWWWGLFAKAPQILSFGVVPGSVLKAGQPFNVQWKTVKADSYRLKIGSALLKDEINGASTLEKIPAQTGPVELTLVAINRFGETEQKISIAVQILLPVIEQFTATPNRIRPGQQVTVAWLVKGAATIEIQNINGGGTIANTKAPGKLTDQPATPKTYKLIATNTAGKSVNREVTVLGEIYTEPTGEFKVGPPEIVLGQKVTLKWDIKNTQSVKLENTSIAGNVAFKGITTDMPRDVGEKTYVLNGQNGDKSLRLERKVIVNPPNGPVIRFSVQPKRFYKDQVQTVTLFWDVQNTTKVNISGIGNVTVNATRKRSTGSVRIPAPSSDTDFQIEAENQGALAPTTKIVKVEVPLPPTANLTVSPNPVLQGDPLAINWQVDNFTPSMRVKISALGNVGQQGTSSNFKPNQNGTVYLSVKEQGRVLATAQASFTVTPKPPVIEPFSVLPTQIQAGQRVTITWGTKYARQVRLEPFQKNRPANGSVTDRPTVPGKRKYKLVVTGYNGDVISKEEEITVLPPPPTIRFSASPLSVPRGGTSRLSWNVLNADAVTIDQGIGTVAKQGTRNVSPAVDTAYTLTASNTSGNSTKPVTVRIQVPPPTILGLTVTPSSVQSGGGVTLRWRVKDADVIRLQPGNVTLTASNTSGKIKSGSATLNPQQNTNYILIASNSTGETRSPPKLVTIIQDGSPTIESFTATPSSITTPGAPVVLKWRVQNATRIVLQPGNITLQGTVQGNIRTGSRTVNPQTTTEYTLIAANSSGSVEKPSTVTVSDGPIVNIKGRWIHNFGDLVLTQNGSSIRGFFHQEGNTTQVDLTGTISGRTVTGAYKLGGITKTFLWNVGANGRTFEGTHAGSKRWCAAKNGTPLPDGCSFSGTWKTTFGNQDCQMTLSVTLRNLREIVNGNGTCSIGNFVGERYFGANGETTVSGRLSDGTDFRFRMNQIDATQFQGKSQEKLQDGPGPPQPWCGWRDNSSPPATCLLSN